MRTPLSCDTSVVLGSLTADGSVIFAKNSDRPPNECQPLHHSPRRQHPAGATASCQYIEIPQVAETWEVIGSRPYWLWGFEIGVNEWGVTIGNEAVHTREPFEERALIGMDLVRLGLERALNAGEAGKLITSRKIRPNRHVGFRTDDHSQFRSLLTAPSRAVPHRRILFSVS